MIYTGSITSQGQLTIPVKLRRKLKLDKKKVNIEEKEGKLLIEPIKDFLELAGSLKTNKKPLSPRKMRELFENYLAQEAVKGLK